MTSQTPNAGAVSEDDYATPAYGVDRIRECDREYVDPLPKRTNYGVNGMAVQQRRDMLYHYDALSQQLAELQQESTDRFNAGAELARKYFAEKEQCAALEQQLSSLQHENEEQARLLGASGSREARLVAEVAELQQSIANERIAFWDQDADNRKAIENREARLNWAQQTLKEQERSRYNLEQQLAEMRGHLRRYGDHDNRCNDDPRAKCTCGFEAALSSPTSASREGGARETVLVVDDAPYNRQHAAETKGKCETCDWLYSDAGIHCIVCGRERPVGVGRSVSTARAPAAEQKDKWRFHDEDVLANMDPPAQPAAEREGDARKLSQHEAAIEVLRDKYRELFDKGMYQTAGIYEYAAKVLEGTPAASPGGMTEEKCSCCNNTSIGPPNSNFAGLPCPVCKP